MIAIFKCPICNGQTTVSKPPYIAGDQIEWVVGSIEVYPCPTCKQKGYIVEDTNEN